MAKNEVSGRSLGQIRASLEKVVEPKIKEIDTKVDYLIGMVREALSRGSYDDWRRYE